MRFLCCRDECTLLKAILDEKTQAVELLTSENQELKAQLEEARVRADTAQAENRMLIDRWMAQKMQDAEKLNEVIWRYDVIKFMSLILTYGKLVCSNIS